MKPGSASANLNTFDTQVEIRDLSKFGSTAVVRGCGMRFEDTTSPVDPGDKGKVAEAVDVCYPDEVGADITHRFYSRQPDKAIL